LHLAFVIPGILYPERSPNLVNAKDALLTFQTNTMGPLLMIKHFHQLLPTKQAQAKLEEDADADSEIWKGLHRSRATFAMMSARVGSITDNKLGGWYSYRASKAGVNQLVKTFDNHLKTTAGDSAMVVGFHPGTVKTGLSKEFWKSVKKEKLFEPEFVAERLVGMCAEDGLDISGRGKCWDWDGKEVPP
jgi:NAD(P)-dependent dehydrogenase (short-subunit alcohol dehydrogenase family)